MTRAVTQNQSYDPYRGVHRSYVSIGTSEISMFDKYSLRLLTCGYDNGATSLSSVSFSKPESLILHITSDLQQGYLTNLLSPLPDITRLEVIAKGHYTSTPPRFSTTHSSLAYLKFNLTNFHSFDIVGYLGPNLQELHVYHNGVNTLSFNDNPLQLPKLKVLGITPPDTNFTDSLRLPRLAKIVIYGPKTTTINRLSLIRLTDGAHFKKIQELELRNWKNLKPNAGEEWGVMSILGEIVKQLRSISTLHFVDNQVDGNRLVDIISALKDTTQMEDSLLNKVVIDCCSGITRDDCEKIGTLVGKVEVFV